MEQKKKTGYLLMILNLSKSNWKLFLIFFFFLYATAQGVLAKRPFFCQYLLKVNNNKTTNELTRVRTQDHGDCCSGEKSRRIFFVFCRTFYIHKKTRCRGLFSRRILKGRKLTAEWMAVNDGPFFETWLFGKCEKI